MKRRLTDSRTWHVGPDKGRLQTGGDAEWAAGMRYLFDDANEKVGNVQKAIECFMRGVQLGNANNMRERASCYESGCGVPQDLSKARKWRAKALGII